jgi:hypothetical protein
MVQPPERAVPGPKGEIVVHRALGRQVFRQGPPLAAGRQHIEDPVQHLADLDGALTATALGRRDEGLDQRPLLIGEIARVPQAMALMRLGGGWILGPGATG